MLQATAVNLLIYVMVYIISFFALLRPNEDVQFPISVDSLTNVLIDCAASCIAIGQIVLIIGIHASHSRWSVFLGTKDSVMWAALAVCMMVVVTHTIHASQQTLVIQLPSEAPFNGISSNIAPLIATLHLCNHNIAWSVLAAQCGAKPVIHAVIQASMWCLTIAGLGMALTPYQTTAFYVAGAFLSLAMIVKTLVLLYLCRLALRNITQAARPVRQIVSVIIPIALFMEWLVVLGRGFMYRVALAHTISFVMERLLDICVVIVLVRIVSDVLWLEEHHVAMQIETERLRVASAEQNSESQKDFLRYLCHELRVPLNGIAMATEELVDGGASNATDFKDNVSIIGMSSMAMAKLLDDCLSLVRIEAGKLTLEVAPFRPVELVDAINSLFHFRFKSLQFQAEIASNVPDVVVGDAGRLRQVVSNFTSNAIKFTPAGGSIKLHVLLCPKYMDAAKLTEALPPLGSFSAIGTVAGTPKSRASNCTPDSSRAHMRRNRRNSISSGAEVGSCSTDRMLVVVQDSGIGISKLDLMKLFRPFAQIKAGATQKGNGTGLGLSICKTIVELSGGSIGCVSEEYRGSKFWFTLPLSSMDLGTGGNSSSTSGSDAIALDYVPIQVSDSPVFQDLTVDPPRMLELKHAVVVDDTDSNRMLLSRMLKRLGVPQVSTAAACAHALDHRDLLTADVWFIDRNMPIMDGNELCTILRARGYKGVIIGVTGDALPDDQRSMLAAGANIVITKPCSKASVSRALHKNRLYIGNEDWEYSRA
jgi:signal transduction histidine kinase/ActR/RegA family two-component response regulator